MQAGSCTDLNPSFACQEQKRLLHLVMPLTAGQGLEHVDNIKCLMVLLARWAAADDTVAQMRPVGGCRCQVLACRISG